jgi:hypothetical protein
MRAEIVLLTIGDAVSLQRTHEGLFAQAIFLAIVGIRQFAAIVVSDQRGNSIVEERSVLRALWRFLANLDRRFMSADWLG